MIHYGKQNINQDDIDAVVNVLKSDFLTQGCKITEFEKDLADYCGVQYAKVVSNGTTALHLAYLAIGLSKGDIVWTTPNTFVATANAALYCGAEVDFVDIDARTYNLSIDALKSKLIQAKKDNKLPKLIVPVHFSGQSCEMKDIWALSKKYGFYIIEDASHALGGEYLDKKVGLPFFKVPSGEILSFDMLSYMSQRKKKIFVSTGMATFKEISYVLNILKILNQRLNMRMPHLPGCKSFLI